MTRSLTTKTIGVYDNMLTVLAPGSLRHHGIVFSPKTRHRIERPDSVGAIRHVRIDLKNRPEAPGAIQGAEVMQALRILYDDMAPTINAMVAKQTRMKAREIQSTPANTVLEFVRPIAARMEDQAVSIWAEVDGPTASMHAERGRHVFGLPLECEPQIRRDAVVIKGDHLHTLSRNAISQISSRYAHSRTDRLRRKWSKLRKVTLAGTAIAVLLCICIGNAIIGSMLIPIVLVCMVVMQTMFSLTSDRITAPLVDMVQDMLKGMRRPTAEQPPVAVDTRIRKAIARYAPMRTLEAAEALQRIEHMSFLSRDSLDPELHRMVASMTSDLREVLRTYERPASLAVGEEGAKLADMLASSVVHIGRQAEDIRMELLKQASDAFDTQHRYVAGKYDPVLSIEG